MAAADRRATTQPSWNKKAPDANSATVSGKSSQDYLNEGNAAFKAEDYKAAIVPYQKALDLEKQNQKLEKKWWFILIDNLSIAYGISGDIRNSRATIEYGLTKETTYPFFYYNLADTYGEEGDEENAIKNLQLAYKYKANVLENEHLPDAATDSSFKKFAGSEKFKKALADLKADGQ
ncbi:MAG: hypothetical protein ABI999_05290 [Acidobacteriota bacterium]